MTLRSLTEQLTCSPLRRLIVVVAILVAAATLLYIGDPGHSPWAPKCPFWLLTGWQCPACGIQRFGHALVTGHPVEALGYNPFLALVVPYVLAFFVRWVLPRGGKGRWRITRVIEHPAMIWGYIVVFVVWGVVRNVLGV